MSWASLVPGSRSDKTKLRYDQAWLSEERRRIWESTQIFSDWFWCCDGEGWDVLWMVLSNDVATRKPSRKRKDPLSLSLIELS